VTSEDQTPKIDLSKPENKLRLKLMLREHQFLWGNISQRNRNSWMMGAFFVPISFLIFSYAVTAKYQSKLDTLLLALASVFSYAAWLILYLRNNRANKVYADRIKTVEKKLKEEYGIDYKPLTETDAKRKGSLEYSFPEFIWAIILLFLGILWLILSTRI